MVVHILPGFDVIVSHGFSRTPSRPDIFVLFPSPCFRKRRAEGFSSGMPCTKDGSEEQKVEEMIARLLNRPTFKAMPGE